MLKTVAIGVLGIALIAVTGLWIRADQRNEDLQERLRAAEQERGGLQRERAVLQSRLDPLEARERAKARIRQDLTIEASRIQSFTFQPSRVPGTLSGSWRASGEGFGGADNTISAFRLTDPEDKLLVSSQHESSGKFVIKVSTPGNYTFYFDNSGLFRTTPRKVSIEADFTAD